MNRYREEMISARYIKHRKEDGQGAGWREGTLLRVIWEGRELNSVCGHHVTMWEKTLLGSRDAG